MAMVMLLTFWLINSAFVHYFFDSNLRAYLTKVEYARPMDNADVLLETKTPLYLPHGTGVIEMFEKSTTGSHRQLYERAVREQTIYNVQDTLAVEEEIVREGKEHD